MIELLLGEEKRREVQGPMVLHEISEPLITRVPAGGHE